MMDCASPFDKKVTLSGTIIVSPNHPKLYENIQDCQLTIEFQEWERVEIEFLAFELRTATEDCSVDTNDGVDWLEVRDGDSVVGERLCGNKIPGRIESTGKSLTLAFHSGELFSHSGFMIQANASKNHFRE